VSRRSAKKARPAKKKTRSKPAAKTGKKPAKGTKKKAKKTKGKTGEPERGAAPAKTARKPAQAAAAKPTKRKRVTAEKLGELQREISISEFFTKNRHLLGFDNASRALLTSVKEAVDNALDACEEAGIQPEIKVHLRQIDDNRFHMSVEDNGPGIVKAQVPKIFGKLLYGSKFHRLRQSRGQQGIGISAAAMYGQLTTGKPCVVTSKTGNGRPAHHYHLVIDTTQNRPIITHDDKFKWAHKDHGTQVEIEMEAIYKGGKRSVDEFIQQVAVANPHARIEYLAPGKPPVVYPRLTEEMPRETKEIKPHPYGVELGILQRMSQATKSRTLSGFLQSEFSRVSGPVAEEICSHARVDPNLAVKELSQGLVEQVYRAISKTKIMSPPTNCLAPIGEAALLDGLKALLVQRHIAEEQAREAKARKRADPEAPAPAQDLRATEQVENLVTRELEQLAAMAADEEEEAGPADATGNGNSAGEDTPIAKAGVIQVYGKQCFITAVSRSPRVYRGNPFLVEAALAYGGELPSDDLATVVRLANRVPLLYQQGACAMSQAVTRTNWRSYDVDQSRGALPSGPLLILVHIASVWVPFTSEAKEAVAHYDEIIGELKFALQECGRRLSRHIRRRRRVADAEKKQKYIERYIPHIGIALQDILGLPDNRRDKVVSELTGILERSRKM
jgi:DNA topoisomerase-6 subunit B